MGGEWCRICQIYKSTNFTCHARNALGDVSRLVRVEVTGPGSAPVLRELNAGRSSIEVHWELPHIINRPLTIYSLHFSTDPSLPIRGMFETHNQQNHKNPFFPRMVPRKCAGTSRGSLYPGAQSGHTLYHSNSGP